MPLPSQTFANMQQLLAYINQYVIPNGLNEITGDEANSVMNGLGNFIIKYSVNALMAGVSSTTGVVSLSKPITIFTVVPTSFQWTDNVQLEYYVINATGSNIPLSLGYFYVDQYGTHQTVIPARTSIHIGKATNGSWFQLNNLNTGGSGNLPPETGHAGEILSTDGNSAFWTNGTLEISGSDFANATDYVNANLVNNKFAILWDDGPTRIYTNALDQTYPASSWKYLTGGGFQMLIPNFNSASNPKPRFTLWLKGLNS